MKRILVFLAFVSGLTVVLAVVRSEVSTDAVSARIAGVLVPFGERTPDVRGDVTVRLFPRLAVVFNGVRIAASTGATLDRPDLTADRIVADIDILPLFIGQTSVSRLVLEHPQLRLQTTFDLAGLTPERALLDRMLPASVVVHHGEIRLQTPDGLREDTFQSIEADLRWPRALGNLSLDGTATWHGERFALSLQGIAPPRLASGEAGDLDVTVDAPALKLNFSGRALLSDRLQLDGVFDAGAGNPQRLADLLSSAGVGIRREASAAVGALPPMAVTGHLRSQGWMGALSDARLQLGTVSADGVISGRLDLPRPQLRGTLAIGDVDLTPALAALKADGWLGWSPEPKTIAGLDIDLRLSIGEAVIGANRLANLAASLLLADGQVHAEVGDATLLGGTGSVILRGTVDTDGLKADGRFTLVGASLNALRSLLRLDGLPPTSGAMSLIGDFETAGRTLNATISQMHGQVKAEAQRLVLDGFAGPIARFATAASPLLQAASLRIGLDPAIDSLQCAMTFAAGEMTVRRLDFKLGGLKFGFTGQTGIGSRAIALSGAARPDPATPPSVDDMPSPASTPVPIRVTGTFDRPIVTFDIGTSGAAPDPGATTGHVPTRPPAAN
jgi:AsmA protein